MGLIPPKKLPEGITSGAWQYTRSDRIAAGYDDYFSANQLFEFDEQVIARHFSKPGLVVDFGCGTGRALVSLARRGFTGLGIDMSEPMLEIVGRKAAEENLPIRRLRANLVELDCLRDDAADYGICLFSTLGMIQGHDNRRRLLEHARRIIKPGGLFVLHVHNVWQNLYDRPGRRWLWPHLLRAVFDRDVEFGDKTLDYRGIRDMFLHVFTQRQLCVALKEAGFNIRELIPLNAARNKRLPRAWFLGRFRANGWIGVCE